ncbi:MAG: hypothetical protein KatS3mg092_0373 [Patescibacteria group bacterium]|nr:MAG: hypothetical protein KatS3mg092_0373 [Patescibacteria group bacterium]
MKKILILIIIFFVFILSLNKIVFANEDIQKSQNQSINDYPRAYKCPPEIEQIYIEKNTGELCTTDYEVFKSDPIKYHFWTYDEEVTIEGRAKERARQFIYWVITHPSIDNHPTLLKIWSSARNVAYFFTILVAALLGMGIIISQKTNFDTGIKIWPSLIRILLSLLYITFSATIVLSIIQLSDILMKFFIETLGGRDLFNTYFNKVSQEDNYNFYGFKDLNIAVQEAVKNQLFVLKLTEITYYLLGGMIILRKIILWFLLFVSPFLATLFSFGFSKNVGWIWVGVFFQWVFYGPLMALFLGGLATIWKNGIPFVFDFSRSETAIGYVYPTATNILWGGPAQKLSILNNINYIDPYAEYIISLIMLWAVIFFPWWLLRTFRDYCCDGINAVKNLLMSSLGNFHNQPPPPSLSPTKLTSFATTNSTTKEIKTEQIKKIETIEEIKKAKTEEIVSSLNMKVSNLTDIANFETNKQARETINYLKNPTQATTISDRQKYINIRVELSNRASQKDQLAGKIVTSIFSPPIQQISQKMAIVNSLPKTSTVTQAVSFKVKLPTTKVQQISSTTASYINTNPKIIVDLASKINTDQSNIKQVLTLLNQQIDKPAKEILENISKQTNLEKQKIAEIVKEYHTIIKSDNKAIEEIANQLSVKPEEVKQVVEAQTPIVTEPEKNIEQMITIPPTVPIDEYEQVKKMWQEQYEKGEIPTNENIKTRDQWVEQDIVVITNTLNKLYSPDESVKQQGLDEVGYILPIFMINNLNGEQLVTYLKAKLEAAKTVKALFDKEKEITEKLKAESDKVEIKRAAKKEEAKTMMMEEELPLKEDK